MKSVVYAKPSEFADDRDDPQPARGEVVVRMMLAGVCGTDLHLPAGSFSPTYPLTPEHEMVGKVTALGSGGANRYFARTSTPLALMVQVALQSRSLRGQISVLPPTIWRPRSRY
jgi:hypothetical protein